MLYLFGALNERQQFFVGALQRLTDPLMPPRYKLHTAKVRYWATTHRLVKHALTSLHVRLDMSADADRLRYLQKPIAADDHGDVVGTLYRTQGGAFVGDYHNKGSNTRRGRLVVASSKLQVGELSTHYAQRANVDWLLNALI